MSLSFLVSFPDLRLLVQDASLDPHEMALVVPQLPLARVFYARMLVDHGSQFVEHAVAFLPERAAVPLAMLRQCLSMARPTQVCAVASDSARRQAEPTTSAGQRPLDVVIHDQDSPQKQGPLLASAAVSALLVQNLVGLAEPKSGLSLEVARAHWTQYLEGTAPHELHSVSLCAVQKPALAARVQAQGQFYEVQLAL